MVTRARKSSEASESRGEAAEEAGKEEAGKKEGPSSFRLSPVSLSANSLSPVLPSLDLTDWRGNKPVSNENSWEKTV